MWEVLIGRVLNGSTFSSQHPCGELPILSFADKGASVGFGMVQLRDVIERCVSDAIMGVVGSGKARSVMGAAESALSSASLATTISESSWWNFLSYVSASCCLSFNIISGICCHNFVCEEFQDLE